MTGLVWPSGVGGAQCDECGETTVVRFLSYENDALGEFESPICRNCAEGWLGNDDDFGDEEYGWDGP